MKYRIKKEMERRGVYRYRLPEDID